MPVDLASDLLVDLGALVEAEPTGVHAVLSVVLQQALGLPELVVLGEEESSHTVACGYGSALLSDLVAGCLAQSRAAVVEADVPWPKLEIPSVYAGINVALRPSMISPALGWTAVGDFLADATADDRRQLRVTAAVVLPSGAPIQPPVLSGIALAKSCERPDASQLDQIEVALPRAAMTMTLHALEEFRVAVARRHRRDALRVHRYFRDLDADLQRRINQRHSGKGLDSKRAALPEERERRLQGLRESYAIRVHLKPLSWQPIACEGCGTGVLSFGACDDEVHLLCGHCLTRNERSCPQCRRGGGRPAPLALSLEAKAEIATV